MAVLSRLWFCALVHKFIIATTRLAKGIHQQVIPQQTPKTQKVERLTHPSKTEDLLVAIKRDVAFAPTKLCLVWFLCKSFHSGISTMPLITPCLFWNCTTTIQCYRRSLPAISIPPYYNSSRNEAYYFQVLINPTPSRWSSEVRSAGRSG